MNINYHTFKLFCSETSSLSKTIDMTTVFTILTSTLRDLQISLRGGHPVLRLYLIIPWRLYGTLAGVPSLIDFVTSLLPLVTSRLVAYGYVPIPDIKRLTLYR